MRLNRLGRVGIVVILLLGASVLPIGAQDASRTPDEVTEGAKTKPVIPNEAGIWPGSIDDSNAGFGELDMTISQHNRAVSGVWETFFNDPSFNESGVLTGTVLTSSINVVLKPSVRRACKVRALGIIISANEVSGNYTAFGCPRGFSDNGSFDIGR